MRRMIKGILKITKSMKNLKIATGIALLIILVLLSAVILGSRGKQLNTTKPSYNSNNSNTQSSSSSKIPTFFYGSTCPHCAEVEAWMAKNYIEQKVKIVKKDVYGDTQNAREMAKAAQNCGLPTDSIGVPFLYAEGKCIIGTPDVISYLSTIAGLTSTPSFH